jgi:hypothetical protein
MIVHIYYLYRKYTVMDKLIELFHRLLKDTDTDFFRT